MRTKRVAVHLMVVGVLAWLTASPVFGGYFLCFVCGKNVGPVVYHFKDRVTRTTRGVCWKCTIELPRCFLCGVPALTNVTGVVQFEDERVLCPRDAKDAVLQEEEGARIYGEAREQIEKQFSRFMSMPGEPAKFSTIDRLHLENLFKIVGRDYTCPEVLGITTTATNEGRLEFEINVLTGLPRGEFRAVCAHEIMHTWQQSNLSEERKKKLGPSAREGFCELLAYLCVDAVQDEAAKTIIVENNYTRGQIALFLEAERTYGLNDVVDWMRWGVDDQLKKDELLRVRAVEVPTVAKPAQVMAAAYVAPAPARVYDTVKLKSVLWDSRHPTALLNDRVIGTGEEVTLRVSGTNVAVRCLEIHKDSVRIQFVESCEEKVLRLGEGK